MSNNITSILKNKESAFIKRAENLMIENMDVSDAKLYKEFKKGITDLDVIKIKEVIFQTNKIFYKTKFTDRVITVFDPVEVLLNLINKDNTISIINMLSILNKNKGQNNLLSNIKLNIKEIDNRLNMNFFKAVAIEKQEKLFKDLIIETNEYRKIDKNPTLLFQLMNRKIKRDKENNKEKSKIRLIK